YAHRRANTILHTMTWRTSVTPGAVRWISPVLTLVSVGASFFLGGQISTAVHLPFTKLLHFYG
ncbi:MAG TPA: hypothetical protein VHM88_12095, partial [Candidatus Acidoferrales bacterium]|nr:hypothetical protein [Candidatus Acidoferrales bacterium]